jgi:lysozyme
MTPATRVRLIAALKIAEGRREMPYQDSRGFWTVGYGHNLTTGPLSEAAISQILADDILAAETACLALPVWSSLSEGRQAALVELTFNQGIGWVGKNPKMYAALLGGDYATAARELLDGPYAAQVGARAARIAGQIEGVVEV